MNPYTDNPRCDECVFSVVPEIPLFPSEMDCHRFPRAIEVSRAHWCGEFQSDADAATAAESFKRPAT